MEKKVGEKEISPKSIASATTNDFIETERGLKDFDCRYLDRGRFFWNRSIRSVTGWSETISVGKLEAAVAVAVAVAAATAAAAAASRRQLLKTFAANTVFLGAGSKSVNI